ncbi:MAG: ribonuclease III [Hyphomicrobiaceae bacterium]
MARRSRKFDDLEAALGCRFNDGALLERALTHSSIRSARTRHQVNERLEFLGDRVLGLAIADSLLQSLPGAKEGDLARQFNKLVCGECCAEVAREIDLGRHVLMASSEAESGGRDKDTILADALEAVLGAIYVDSGFEKAKKVVTLLWGERLNVDVATPVDAKSALQEWAQGRGHPLPFYVEVSRRGPDHAPRFIAEVRVQDAESVTGSGSSKRQAEQAAAAAFLLREGIWTKDS